MVALFLEPDGDGVFGEGEGGFVILEGGGEGGLVDGVEAFEGEAGEEAGGVFEKGFAVW